MGCSSQRKKKPRFDTGTNYTATQLCTVQLYTLLLKYTNYAAVYVVLKFVVICNTEMAQPFASVI